MPLTALLAHCVRLEAFQWYNKVPFKWFGVLKMKIDMNVLGGNENENKLKRSPEGELKMKK